MTASARRGGARRRAASRIGRLALLAVAAGCVSTGARGGAVVDDRASPFPPSRANEWVTLRDFRYVTAAAASQSLAFFGTTAGVERLDTLRDRWLAPVTAVDGLPDDRVTALAAEPSSGDLWIGTARGLARLVSFVDVIEPVFGPPSFRVDRLLVDPRDGTVWAEIGGVWWRGPNGSPVLERSGSRPPFERLVGPVPVDDVDPSRLPWTDPLWVPSELLPGARFRLTVLDRDRRGDWYVGTWGDNGRRWAAARQAWEPLYFGLAGPGGPIAASRSGYWFPPGATPARGPGSDASLAPGGVRFALSAGSPAPAAVAHASRDLSAWSYAVPLESPGLPAATAHAAVAAGDTVWLATDHGIVRGVDGRWERWGPRDPLPVAARALALEPGRVWAGGDDGLVALDRRDGAPVARFLAGRRVDAVAVTPEAVYAGTQVGLFAGRRTADPEGADGVPPEIERVEPRGGAIRTLAVTDTLLVVGTATGIEVFDRRAGEWSVTARAGEGRLDHPPLALAVDADGQVWIGSAAGLARWRPATGEWDEWTSADGLAAGPVLHLLAEDGVVWASTPSGVSRFAWEEAGR